MDHIELKKFVESYEISHAVDEYIVDGWHVWPLLKIVTWWWWFTASTQPRQSKLPRSLRLIWTKFYSVFTRVMGPASTPKTSKEYLASNHDVQHEDSYDAKRDVVVLTISQRRVMLDNALYEIYSDPLVKALHQMKKSTLVWELGEERYPRHSNSAWISRRIKKSCEQLSLVHTSSERDEPAWFNDFSDYATELTGRVVGWQEVSALIDNANKQATIFEKWLRKTGARYLFVVNWYNPLVMSAIMAAKRCGIKTIDLQHGVGGEHDFSYVSWMKVPENGYEQMPDVFWRWGNNSVEEIKKFNPGFSRWPLAVAGGNLWLNQWLEWSRDARATKEAVSSSPFQKIILVTLQLEIEPMLLEAIKISPPSWKWMIRSHPRKSEAEREQEQRRFTETGHPGIEFDRSNNQLLYELLVESDIHVTGDSASAVEALAFGVLSITITDLGRSTYSAFLKQGLMVSANDSSELVDIICKKQDVSPDAALEISNIFASNQASLDALRIIMSSDKSIN